MIFLCSFVFSHSRVEVPDSCPDFMGRATSGFRPKLHSRAESMSLESLDMSRAVGRLSLDIPKFGRESLDMGRESLDIPKFGRKSLDLGRESLDIPKFGRKSLDIPKFGRESLDMGRESLDLPKIGRESLLRPMSRLSRPNLSMSRFSRPMSRLSRPNFGMSRLSWPTTRLMYRFSRLKLLGATMQFGSKSGCGATLGATHVQIVCSDFPVSNSRRDYAIWV